MRLAIVSCCMTMFLTHNVFALDKAETRQLEELSPSERMEQRCDVEAMSRIGKQNKEFHPDKVIAYTFAKTKGADNTLSAPGAVFRSKGAWYHLQYTCVTANDHLDVTSFTFKIGEEVPKSAWSKYYLYD